MHRLSLLVSLVAACSSGTSALPRQAFLKGQLHVHSNHSGDSQTPPADVVAWYAAHGYDFIVFTDHNVVTSAPGTKDMLVIPGVEITQNLETCDPPGRCLLHVNALFVNAPDGPITLPDAKSDRRVDLFGRAIDLTKQLGGLAMINHPNFGWAADADLLAKLAARGATLVEIANQSGVANEGDATHAGTEAMWDDVTSRGVNLWGTATDDAHHYDDAAAVRARGETAYTGDLGWVMVHAAKNPAAIRAALAAGDFYSSTGVILGTIARPDGALELTLAPESAGEHRFQFIGASGKIMAESTGRSARFELAKASPGYVRVVVSSPDGQKKAWTQPIRVP